MAFTQPQNVVRSDLRTGHAHVRTPATVGLPVSLSATGSIICGAREVAIIDEVCINTTTADTAVNTTIGIKINGLTVPIHFPGTANLLRSERLVWRPRGLVVQPGQFFAANNANVGSVFQSNMLVRFRKKSINAAIADGDIRSSGSYPNVASAFSVSGAATANGVARQIVPPVTGKSVEIMSMLFTGHNYNAAADNIRLGFWDGTTGATFAVGGNTIIRAWRQNANVHYAKPLVINNTDGCIQGPSGYGVYIQPTTNLAGATPTGDWVITYRYVDAPLIAGTSTVQPGHLDVGDPTGAAGQTTFGKKFWVNTEAAVTSTVGNQQLTRMFGAVTGFDTLVKIKGWVTSATVATTASALINEIGIGLGTGTVAIAGTQTLGEMMSMFASDDGAGSPTAVGHMFGQDETLIVTNMSSIPAFAAVEVASGDFANRSQLVWGRLGESPKLTNQDVVGQSQYTFIV